MAYGISQIMARLPNNERAMFEQLAIALDIPLSELMRQSLFFAQPHFQKEAQERANRAENLPHGVTDTKLEEAFYGLIKQVNKGDVLTLKGSDLFKSKSKALWAFLSIIWQESPEGSQKILLDKLSEEAVRILSRSVKGKGEEEPSEPPKLRPRKRVGS